MRKKRQTEPLNPQGEGKIDPSPVDADGFAERLLAWFDRSGRHDLPWQHPRTPYRVWVAEIMLQQTQVNIVVPYYTRFLDVLPTSRHLAEASHDRVMALWAGLGYYARARNLHAAAKLCVERHDGELPMDFDALCALPGIGRSTAGAILAQAGNLRFPILDGNVKRVLCRYHGIAGWPGTPAVEKTLWALAEQHLPQARHADYIQAQMDFGATLCTRHDPACVLCTLQGDCIALREGRVDRLPEPKPGKPLPERRILMLLISDRDGRILLVRRPPVGVWAGLWSLPEAADHDAARRLLAQHATSNFDHAEPLAPVEHGFTHYHLRIQPLRWRNANPADRIGDNEDDRWLSPAESNELGLPAPVRRLLASL